MIGWFQGRMEWGPRALGSRSILADARDPEMKDRLNEKIKLREGFRPFAPSVLEEDAPEWFELDRPSPYMLLTAQVRGESPDDPLGDARGWLGAPPDGECTDQSALSRADQASSSARRAARW